MMIKNIPKHLPPTNYHRNKIIDFMAYARKVLTKKENLRTYNNFFISLWSMISFLFELYNWLDTAFDVYKENSIKTNQQRRKTIISGFDQPLPVEIDRLWSVSNNQSARQQLF